MHLVVEHPDLPLPMPDQTPHYVMLLIFLGALVAVIVVAGWLRVRASRQRR